MAPDRKLFNTSWFYTELPMKHETVFNLYNFLKDKSVNENIICDS